MQTIFQLLSSLYQLLSAEGLTQQGAAFIGGCIQSAGGSDHYSFVQLWNPSASGKNLIVAKLIIVRENCVLSYFQIGNCATAIDTSDCGHKNKLLGGASGVAKIYKSVLETAEFPVGYSPIQYPAQPGGGVSSFSDYYVFSPDIMVPPGQGLTVQNTDVNKDFCVGFEWTERNI